MTVGKSKLLRTITFLWRPSNLDYLRMVLSKQLGWTDFDVTTIIISDIPFEIARTNLQKIDPLGSHSIIWAEFSNLSDPWLLTWCHKSFHKEYFDRGFDIFIHSEEDIVIYSYNIHYWLEHRAKLFNIGCFPLLVRTERGDRGIFCTDLLEEVKFRDLVSSLPQSDFSYYHVSNPYQAAFIYDRDLMREHIEDKSFSLSESFDLRLINSNPHHPGGGVAEKAVFGITFSSLTPPLKSRALLPVISETRFPDTRCFTYHCSNSYLNSNGEFCKVSAMKIMENDLL